MLIERLELIGFGNITGQKIEFAPNKLNLVLESNDYGKSTIAEAIWAILYGDEKDPASKESVLAKKPLSGAAFKGLIDLSLDGKRLRVIRDFTENSLKVLDLDKDLGKAEADITAQYVRDGASPGLAITGITSGLFANTALIRQRDLNRNLLRGDRALSSLLLSMADTAGAASTAFDAVQILTSRLESFPYRGKIYRLDDLNSALQRGRDMLTERARTLEGERARVVNDLQRLAEVEEKLQRKTRQLEIQEYFQLCLEAAELDSRIMSTEERINRSAELRRELSALAAYENFHLERVRLVDELWAKREARLSDKERVEADLKVKRQELQHMEQEFRFKADGLADFTAEDAQNLASLARTLQQTLGELDDARAKREREARRAKDTGVDFKSLSQVRKTLLALDSRELDSAHAWNGLIVDAREKIAEHERIALKARSLVNEIVAQRQASAAVVRYAGYIFGFIDLVLFMVLFWLVFAMGRSQSDPGVLISGSLFCGVTVMVGLGVIFSRLIETAHRKQEEEKALQEEKEHLSIAQELNSKVGNLELRVEELAVRVGLSSADQLVKYIQDYASASVQLKELDMFEQMVTSSQNHVLKLQQEIQSYFAKSGRHIERVTPRAALELADAINKVQEERRAVQNTTAYFDHKYEELKFIEDEINSMEMQLAEIFREAGLPTVDIEASHHQFLESVKQVRRREALMMELNGLEGAGAAGSVPEDLSRGVEKLESKRAYVWTRMKEILGGNPDLVAMPPPAGDDAVGLIASQIAELRTAVEALRKQRDDLLVKVGSATRNYDDYYLKTVEELETIERDLERIKRTSSALKLARDTFLKLAQETHSIWARRLTDLSKDMLKQIGSEFDSLEFDSELCVSARRRGTREPVREDDLERVASGGSREQINLLARLAVVRFLARDNQLPIIMDEPFAEFDDERFNKMMRFLLNSVLGNHQVILLSCHQSRHTTWSKDLSAQEADLLNFCRLEPILSDAGIMVRR